MGAEKKNFDKPDERRSPDKSTIDMVTVGGTSIGRARFEPGWRWSECIKPVVGGDSCQVHHVAYAISGKMHVVLDDGSELDFGAGEAADIPPGHDAWVV